MLAAGKALTPQPWPLVASRGFSQEVGGLQAGTQGDVFLSCFLGDTWKLSSVPEAAAWAWASGEPRYVPNSCEGLHLAQTSSLMLGERVEVANRSREMILLPCSSETPSGVLGPAGVLLEQVQRRAQR